MWASNYSAADQLTALQASQRTWRFRYELYDGWYEFKGPVVVEKCNVEYNALATGPNRTAKFRIPAAEAANIDFYGDQIKAYAELLMPDGGYATFSVGTFDVTTSGRRWINKIAKGGNTVQATESVEVVGYDGLVRLQQASSHLRYASSVGEFFTEEMKGPLSSVRLGIQGYNITPSTVTEATQLEWEVGTSYLTIVNNLCEQINYDPIHLNGQGIATTGPYTPPELASVAYTYLVDRKSVIIPGIDVELDLFDIPNVFVAMVSEPDRPPLRSMYTNDDPNSPFSVGNRGREIVKIIDPALDSSRGEITSAATQAILDEKVTRAAQEATQQFEVCEFTTGLMPFHDHADVLMIDYGAGDLRYRETAWSMDLVAGGQMKHSMRRVVVL